MQYDPVKRVLGGVFKRTPFLRILFYNLLDLLLLRSYYIRRELKKWKKTAPADAMILDAGSGFGQYVWRLSRLGSKFRIKGIDLKSEQIDDCNIFFQGRGLGERISFSEADLLKYQEADTYNLILSVDVMEHIEDDLRVMKNLYHSLKKGGLLIISTPSDKGGSDTDHHSDDAVTGFIDEHVRDGYNINDISNKLYEAGFSTVSTNYTYGWPGSLSWKLSMKFPLILLNKSKLFFLILPFYYLLFYPLSFILNHIDIRIKHNSGTGLLVKATK